MTTTQLSDTQVRAAYAIAFTADLLQLPLSAISLTGILTVPGEVVDFFIDCTVMVILSRYLGFHWLLLPAMAAETFPGVELLPTWSASVAMLVKIRRDEFSHEEANAPTSGFTRQGPRPASEPPPLPITVDNTTQSRLAKLDALLRDNLITPEEYEAKRREILAEL